MIYIRIRFKIAAKIQLEETTSSKFLFIDGLTATKNANSAK